MTFLSAFRAAVGGDAHRRGRQHRITAQALRALDDRTLRDIGLLRDELRTSGRGQRGYAGDRYPKTVNL